MINNRQNGRRRGRGGAQMRGPGNGGQDRGNRIDNRARGNAAQLLEKYKNLARDAQLSGDRVMTEYYLQFADHYFRVLGESRARFEEQNQQRRQRYEADEFDDQGDEGEGPEDGGVDEGQGEPRMAAPRRFDRDQDQRPRREEGYDREPRRERQDRNRDDRGQRAEQAQPAEAEQEASGNYEPEAEEAPRPRRGRRPRRAEAEDQGDTQQRIDVDRLPPAFASEPAPQDATHGHDAEAAEPEAKPRRRRTRAAASSEDSNVAA